MESKNIPVVPRQFNDIPDPEKTGMLEIAKANDTVRRQSMLPDPVDLYRQLWHEGEIACLFADTNVGKSILAVQIGETIAKSKPVLYIDGELTDKQFQLRYTNPDTKRLHSFPDMFYRASVSEPDYNDNLDYEERLMGDIEKAAQKVGASVIIIDNIGYLCLSAEKSDEAARLMLSLCRLKKVHGWSVLVIAHTPKRREAEPISINDLAGSKKLANFCDTIFAIGQSQQDMNIRYVKQLKVRMGEHVYTNNNVMMCRVEMVDGICLRFIEIGSAKERDMLSDGSQFGLKAEAIRLRREGLSLEEIAKTLNKSKSTIGDWTKGEKKGERQAPLITPVYTEENDDDEAPPS